MNTDETSILSEYKEVAYNKDMSIMSDIKSSAIIIIPLIVIALIVTLISSIPIGEKTDIVSKTEMIERPISNIYFEESNNNIVIVFSETNSDGSIALKRKIIENTTNIYVSNDDKILYELEKTSGPNTGTEITEKSYELYLSSGVYDAYEKIKKE